MAKFKELKNKIATVEKKIFSTDDYFTIANKEKFNQDIVRLSGYDRDKVEIFLIQISSGIKLSVSIVPSYNEKKELSYYYVSPPSVNLNRGYKLPDIEGITKLINIYEADTHIIDLNIEDLYESSLS